MGELEKEFDNSKKDVKYYKKKHEASKKKLEEDQVAINNLKQEVEILTVKSKENGDELLRLKEVEIKLREEKAELKGKLSLQRDNCAEANLKLKKYSNNGPNSEISLQKKCSKLEKQLEVARRI